MLVSKILSLFAVLRLALIYLCLIYFISFTLYYFNALFFANPVGKRFDRFACMTSDRRSSVPFIGLCSYFWPIFCWLERLLSFFWIRVVCMCCDLPHFGGVAWRGHLRIKKLFICEIALCNCLKSPKPQKPIEKLQKVIKNHQKAAKKSQKITKNRKKSSESHQKSSKDHKKLSKNRKKSQGSSAPVGYVLQPAPLWLRDHLRTKKLFIFEITWCPFLPCF